MNNFTKLASIACIGLLSFSSCERDKTDAIPVIPPSDGSKLTLNGGEGESDAVNAVYVDFSTDQQTAVARKSWSLGFYSGSDFRVIINNQVGYSAMATTQTDLKSVTSSNQDLTKLAHSTSSLGLIKNYDDTLGRINHTVIAEVKANANDNKVYLVNTVNGTTVDKNNVWKVKITRANDKEYSLQYAKIDDANAQTLTVKKDEAYNFNFISFTNGPVKVEPKKEEWDFVWNKSMYFTFMGTTAVPYLFSDLVFINHLNGVQAAEVVFLSKDGKTNGNPSYEEFDANKISTVKFSSSRNIIGSTWRSTFATGVYKDRYYVVKDKQGNIYKLKFLVMGIKDDGGKRGFPELEYKLVKGN